MTLQHSYGANGISDSYAFSFPIDQEADIQVLIDNIEQLSGFTVHGAASPGGGVVVFLAPPSAGKTILIRHRGRVAVSSADASSGYLGDKLVAGTGISLSPLTDPEGRQTLVIGNTEDSNALDPDQNLADLTDKAAARDNLGVYSTTQVNDAIAASSALDLKKANNLSDVASVEQARTNLGVSSATQVTDAIAASSTLDLKKAQNLADLADKAVARSNLDVYAKGEVYAKAEADAAYADRTLSNLTNAASARTNLGLDHVAYVNVTQDWTQPQRNQAVSVATVGGSVALDMAVFQNFDLTLSTDVTFANPALSAAMVGQRGTIGIVPAGFAIAGMGGVWKRVGETGAPAEISGQGRIDYHIRALDRIEYAYNDVEA
ncbi:hypothetical protein [Magnetospirillum sulfuroxidans]|uniref:Uncharacterized protein n=1 Tax=Magnetospirillum sulfuroxidans TaxID=611300 RepID=A0ABS5IA73_9PROT|nr:hypothetical protein [Magnetospirillum sulfuroxidans]MBR9971224.1 hypothetical protein [Magnetospirillum sulfuroxidans]